MYNREFDSTPPFTTRRASPQARRQFCSAGLPSAAPSARTVQIETLESRTLLTTTLASATEFSGVTSPHGILTCDFKSGDTADVAVAGIDPNSGLPTVAVYLQGTGTPTYNDLPASQLAFDLATADFDQDGHMDIAVTDPVGGTVTVLLGNGDGTFKAPIVTHYGTAQAAGSSPVAYIVAADFTGDGKPDLAVTDPGDHQIVLLLGNGNGTFSTGTPVTINEDGFDPMHIVAATFAGSPNMDIAFNDGTTPDLYVAEGDGMGGFAIPSPTHVTGAIEGIAEADLTGDGMPDCVLSISLGGVAPTDLIDVLLNSGGQFAAATPLNTTFLNPGPIVIADVNGDGSPDIVTMDASGTLNYFQGDNSGAFNPAIASQPTTGSPQALATADVNGDGKADIVFSETNAALAGGGGFGQILGSITPTLSPQLGGTLPSSGIAGQPIRLSQKFLLTNISTGTVQGNATIQLALSTDQSYHAGDPIIDTVVRKEKLKSNKSQLLNLSVRKLPTGITSGLYYVIAVATDPAGAIDTTSSAGQINIAAPTIDLSGSVKPTGTFKTTPPAAKAGRNLNVSITITNTGNVAASGFLPIVVDTSIDNTLDGNAVPAMSYRRRINIKPGKSLTFSLTRLIAPTTADSYFLIVQLDPGNTLGDANPANNTFASSSAIVVS